MISETNSKHDECYMMTGNGTKCEECKAKMLNKKQRKILLAQRANAQKERVTPIADGTDSQNATDLENGTKTIPSF